MTLEKPHRGWRVVSYKTSS